MSICVSSKIQYPNKLEYSIFCCTYSWHVLDCRNSNVEHKPSKLILEIFTNNPTLKLFYTDWRIFGKCLSPWHKHLQWIPAMFIAKSFKLFKEELWQLKPPCNISEILCRQQTLKFPRATNQCFPRHHIHGYETQLKMFSQTDLSSSLK